MISKSVQLRSFFKILSRFSRIPPNIVTSSSRSLTPFLPSGHQQFNNYWLFTLALFWPLKKENAQGNEKKESIEVVLEKYLVEADQLFDNGQYNECYEVLKTLRGQFEVHIEVMWRKSRVLYQMATAPNVDSSEKARLAEEAYKLISEALECNNNHFAVHKWMSIILDLRSSCIGTKERIKNLAIVKKHMMKAIEINPNDATTLYMLGEWCYGIADMPWYQRRIAQTLFATPPNSSFDEAIQYFSKAEIAEPRFYSMNLLMLGKTYLKLGKEDIAKYYLNLALNYPARTNDDHRANKEAQEILNNLK